jgi:alpha-beta hydrolase superfamily lysophospholipase
VFWWEPWRSLRKASRELRDTLFRALWTTRVREVILVGHSVGGLVAAHSLAGLVVPSSRKLTVVTIGAPFAGMMGPPFYDDDALNSPAMISVMGTFRVYPRPPVGAQLFEYVTSWPSDPVMQPRYGHQVAPPEIGPPGGKRIAVDPKFDHNKIVSRIVVELLRQGRPPEIIAP